MQRRITTREALHRARIAAGLTVRELAERSGVAERTINYIESGKSTRPRTATVVALADALGVDRPSLLPLEDVSA